MLYYSTEKLIKLALILQTTTILFASTQNVGENCNNNNGNCKFLTECPPIFDNLNSVPISFCDELKGVVCCPKESINIRATYHEDLSKTSEKECETYRNEVYGKCEPTPLIVDGTAAKPKELPHMALLGLKNVTDIKVKFVCGGSLISRQHVLTAAHCFARATEPDMVRLGELDYATSADDAQPMDYNIRQYIAHPQYDYVTKYNDIAVIVLDRVVSFNQYIAPACLPQSHGAEFSKFTAAGWGSTSFLGESSTRLLKVVLERFADSECVNITGKKDALTDGVRISTQLCAGSRTDKRDTCQGDSGGPLFVEHPKYPCMYQIVGITSFGVNCGSIGVPGVYSRVNLYVDWIENIVWNTPAPLG